MEGSLKLVRVVKHVRPELLAEASASAGVTHGESREATSGKGRFVQVRVIVVGCSCR